MVQSSTVLLIGAGATVADAVNRPEVRRPPLDKGFFRGALKDQAVRQEIETVATYLREHYGTEDLRRPESDSLEGVMLKLYADIFDPALGDDAYDGFLALLRAFNRRLANTTNDLDMTPRRLLYRVIRRHIEACGQADRLTIITFNQDLQIEKALLSLSRRLPNKLGNAFYFPGLYGLADTAVTRPGEQAATFPVNQGEAACVRLLKLHGSLNWYSTHRSRAPERRALFNPERTIEVTARSEIAHDIVRRRRTRTVFTFPIVVPPVNHKSAILHAKLRPLWQDAEECLVRATAVTIFGYSCPAADFESENMLRRAFSRNTECENLAIIDPNAQVMSRFAELTAMEKLSYFRTATPFFWETA